MTLHPAHLSTCPPAHQPQGSAPHTHAQLRRQSSGRTLRSAQFRYNQRASPLQFFCISHFDFRLWGLLPPPSHKSFFPFSSFQHLDNKHPDSRRLLLFCSAPRDDGGAAHSLKARCACQHSTQYLPAQTRLPSRLPGDPASKPGRHSPSAAAARKPAPREPLLDPPQKTPSLQAPKPHRRVPHRRVGRRHSIQGPFLRLHHGEQR